MQIVRAVQILAIAAVSALSMLPSRALAQNDWDARARAVQIFVVESLPPGSSDALVIRRRTGTLPNVILLRHGSDHSRLLSAAAGVMAAAATTRSGSEAERRYWISSASLRGPGSKGEKQRMAALARRIVSGQETRMPGYGLVQSTTIGFSALRPQQ